MNDHKLLTASLVRDPQHCQRIMFCPCVKLRGAEKPEVIMRYEALSFERVSKRNMFGVCTMVCPN